MIIITMSDKFNVEENYQPFLLFTQQIRHQSDIRSKITKYYLLPENKIIPTIITQAFFAPKLKTKIQKLAYVLVHKLRHQTKKSNRRNFVQKILQEFSLSSQEGICLMCLAEALLRIPDNFTRDMLIQDKLGKGKWKSHLGSNSSLFINATTWSLYITGKILNNNISFSNLLNRVIKKISKPIVRNTINIAIRIMGGNFITGENIYQALINSESLESKGFKYSYDMLGEAALTSQDAKRYFSAYQNAIHAIGKYSNNKGIYEGPGISIKLSALHPRYYRTQYDRVINELYPKLKNLTLLAQQYDIGINIDAEESYRLDLSLDLLEKLCFEEKLAGWNGIGFVIQAYQKSSLLVIDAIIDIAQRTNHRIMIRLVKGAYWDTEIKRAQVDGLDDYPVYTRKVYTDMSYLICARKLLAYPKYIYPQFATHNAHTVAAIYYIAGRNYYPGQYEFQCLHGMGEILYNEVVGKISEGKLNRPCRIYAPVGNYETLLAYLVRRILENGANNSFINRLANNDLSIEDLIIDPTDIIKKLAITESTLGLSHPKIPNPKNLYGIKRLNARGIDLSNEVQLACLSYDLMNDALNKKTWFASPMIKATDVIDLAEKNSIKIINPAEFTDIVGYVRETNKEEINIAFKKAVNYWPIWLRTPIKKRASILQTAALTIENSMHKFISLLVREAGKTLINAIAEVREAIDFLRYYSYQIIVNEFNNDSFIPLGLIVCISPWNFPLAIFIGQIAAALSVGNSVLAKPSEETPLVAAHAVHILHQAGIPKEVLQLITGGGKVGHHLITDERVEGIMFTGSTKVAKLIQHNIFYRKINQEKYIIPLIAETGGINAMIVDSSALLEQVVTDIIASAFDSAGQRCSALRLLCLQQEIAEKTLNMLKATMDEYFLGKPDQISTDIGPVINIEAKNNIQSYIKKMQKKGFKIYQSKLKSNQKEKISNGNFIQPTLIEINKIEDLKYEIFGPVLHIVQFKQSDISEIINKINKSGYGLTLGLHTRIDTSISLVSKNANIGNIYINRNMVGAVVGVQPFGGEGLSGTGPKAGGPLYLYRLLSYYPEKSFAITLNKYEKVPNENCREDLLKSHHILTSWAKLHNNKLFNIFSYFEKLSQCGRKYILPGPTGEDNIYSLLPRKCILCIAYNEKDILIQLAAVTSTGNCALWLEDKITLNIYKKLPNEVQKKINFTDDIDSNNILFDTIIFHGKIEFLQEICKKIANYDGGLIPIYNYAIGDSKIFLERLLRERCLSINTTATGGNTNLINLN